MNPRPHWRMDGLIAQLKFSKRTPNLFQRFWYFWCGVLSGTVVKQSCAQYTTALYEWENGQMCLMVLEQILEIQLSCDPTFKTSKHVGATREDDGKFVRQFENVFLALNENGEVMAWRFTKSTSFSEIYDLLKDLKCRLDKTGVTLEMVLVDDCCHIRNFTNKYFRGPKFIWICFMRAWELYKQFLKVSVSV